jgi:hypothetical protein
MVITPKMIEKLEHTSRKVFPEYYDGFEPVNPIRRAT